jgi:uncharacterized membrane protein YfcA
MASLPFGLGPWELAILGVGLLAAAYARGLTGFGFSALLVGTGAIVTDPVKVVPLAIVLEVLASIMQAVSAWKHVDWRRVGAIIAGTILGNPFGVALLVVASANALRLGISGLILLACIALLAGWHIQRRLGTAGSFVLGVGSGLANGATALGGLPVALFLAASREAPHVMRASLVAFFFVTDLYAAGIMAWRGVLGAETLHAAAWALPVVVAGLWLGGRKFAATTPEGFRRFTLILLIVLALVGIGRAASML